MSHKRQPQSVDRHLLVAGPRKGVGTVSLQELLRNVHQGRAQMGAMEAVLPDDNEHLLVAHLHAYSAVDPAVKHSEGKRAIPIKILLMEPGWEQDKRRLG